MATLLELTAQIVASHASGSSLTSEELLRELQNVYGALMALEAGEVIASEQLTVDTTAAKKINFRQYFKKDEVVCLICNRGGFKTLKRHLMVAHQLKPGQYRKQFNIPAKYSLVASSYSEQRKKDALDRGQGELLAKARAARTAKAVKAVKVAAKAVKAEKKVVKAEKTAKTDKAVKSVKTVAAPAQSAPAAKTNVKSAAPPIKQKTPAAKKASAAKVKVTKSPKASKSK
ncbi:MAG TPA: MucR family transcriptional regulator [Desulfuromonadales bacterium]|nr:MucR family transcriptional regulator [Desulfuromonadales bacterium]